jgi:RNA polymerase sigma factor (sigma-70 family)
MEAFILKARLPEPAEDVLQHTLVGITQGLIAFQGATDRQFWKYCYTIARCRIADVLRKEDRDKTDTFAPDELERLIDATANSPDQDQMNSDDVKFAIDILRNAQGVCLKYLQLRFVEGWDYESIAAALDLPSEDAARMRISRCLKDARSLLAKHF